MRTQGRSGGFTLIEMMITVAIIGILATTAVTLFRGQQFRSKRAEGMTNVEALAKMVKTFFGESGVYPGVAAPEPAPAPAATPEIWTPAASAAFSQIGFAAEGSVRYRYDVDSPAIGECACPTRGCFTVAAYSDLEGDGRISGVGYYHPDGLGLTCPTVLFGWVVPFDGGGFPITDAAVGFDDPIAALGPDDY
jgi:prepilin-type N-terminal cleavage/methylation domain-containing protein